MPIGVRTRFWISDAEKTQSRTVAVCLDCGRAVSFGSPAKRRAPASISPRGDGCNTMPEFVQRHAFPGRGRTGLDRRQPVAASTALRTFGRLVVTRDVRPAKELARPMDEPRSSSDLDPGDRLVVGHRLAGTCRPSPHRPLRDTARSAGALRDRAVVHAIQRGLASGANDAFKFGRFESAICHFHRTLDAALA